MKHILIKTFIYTSSTIKNLPPYFADFIFITYYTLKSAPWQMAQLKN